MRKMIATGIATLAVLAAGAGVADAATTNGGGPIGNPPPTTPAPPVQTVGPVIPVTFAPLPRPPKPTTATAAQIPAAMRGYGQAQPALAGHVKTRHVTLAPLPRHR